MIAVILGIGSALVFGTADFLGGIASKRISPLRVTAIAGVTGFVTLLIALPVFGGTWSLPAVFYGFVSGVSGSVAIVLLYACLAIGPMSILSPLTAVVSAIVPMTIGLARGERLGAIGYVALGLALVAVVLVGFVKEEHAVRPSLRGLLMATASGLLIGLFLVAIDLTPRDSGLVPLVVNRVTNAAIMFGIVGIVALVTRSRRPEARPAGGWASSGWRAGLWFAIWCGFIDAIANAGILASLRLGDLSITAVLTALYPAGTIVLAAIVLRERIAIVQYVGLALAITAAAMFALV